MFLTRVKFHVPHLVTTIQLPGLFIFQFCDIENMAHFSPKKEELVKFTLGKQTFSKFPPFFCAEKTKKKLLKERKRKLHPIRVFFSNFCDIKNLSHFSRRRRRRRINTRICTTNKKVSNFWGPKTTKLLEKRKKNHWIGFRGGRDLKIN